MFDQTTRKYTFQAFTSFHLPYLTHARPEQHFHNKILETDISDSRQTKSHVRIFT